MVRKGIVEWAVRSVLDNLTVGLKAQLDELAIEFKNTHRQQYRNKFPKTSFASGFTNLSNIFRHPSGLLFKEMFPAQFYYLK